jgi:hypothetical protein
MTYSQEQELELEEELALERAAALEPVPGHAASSASPVPSVSATSREVADF